VPIVRSHHEWWNGAGYPDGLKGEEIPIGARVLTVVDCFDALISDRPYRKGMSADAAMAILKSMAGTQFDPAVVAVLESLYEKLGKKARELDLPGFTPLNTGVAVNRGIAPGSGFAEDREPLPLTQQPAQRIVATDQIEFAQREAQALLELSQSLGSSLRLKEVIALIASRLRPLVPYDACALYFLHGKTLHTQYLEGEFVKSFNAEPIPEGQGISGWVAQNGKAILNGNATIDPNYQPKPGQVGSLQSALSIPLFDIQKQVFAVLTLYSSTIDSFQRDHLRILQAIEPKLSLSLRNALHARNPEGESGSSSVSQEQLLLMEAARI
jgi:putative methionine-R-sulfoxide reductase with GAF domain